MQLNQTFNQTFCFTKEKPFYSLNDYFKQTFGEKVYKIAIDAGFTCPNRDGTLDTRGCIFCSHGGSGDFAVKDKPDIDQCITEGINLISNKKIGDRFIAYFQAYTNTYGSKERLFEVYSRALSHEKIIGISIGTRPDCLGEEVFEVLDRCKELFPEKFIWIELGLQTIHEKTATYIRRGYPLSVFEEAMANCKVHDIPVIVHLILGLPGETEQDMLDSLCYVNLCKPFGIKLQLLHVLKNTDLATDYESGHFTVFSKEEYLSVLANCLMHLDPSIVVHRITGDGPKDLLIAPLWSANKKDVLNSFRKKLKELDAYQGKLFKQ